MREYDVSVKQVPLPTEDIMTPDQAAEEIEKYMKTHNITT
jgi:hypothetical protein